MPLTSLEIVDIHRWCHPVAAAAEATAGRGNLIADVGAAEVDRIDLPDACADAEEAMRLYADGFSVGVEYANGRMRVAPRWLARLEDATVRNGCGTIHVADGIALAESYHKRWVFEYVQAPPAPYWTVAPTIAGPHGAETVPIRVYDRREPDQTIAGPAVLLYSRWCDNYCHWMIEALPRLWCLDVPGVADLPIVVPGELTAFHRETLAALGVLDRAVPFTGRVLHADTLIVPSFIAPAAYAKRQVDWMRRTLPAVFGLGAAEPRDRIYVSRAKARARRIANDADLTARLARRGFRTVFLEDLTVAEQIDTFRHAEIVVAPHGAGNTNMIFAPEGAALLELMPAASCHPMYYYLSKLAGARYGILTCAEAAADTPQALHVDLDRLEERLDALAI